ncbi:rootletin-like [Protopterus annectens]|uniref:rootletin-like n=1 Tax=Protopterus annectens TaxID=7888 RepID=UPI001CFA62B1|nr:rootletin-like [Protopterus annectens]
MDRDCHSLTSKTDTRCLPSRRQHLKNRLQTSTDVLEKLLGGTTLTTQRVTHLHILALGDELQRKKLKKPNRVSLEVSVIPEAEEEEDDDIVCRLKEMLQDVRIQAEQEKQATLQEQKQTFQQILAEIARNRDHLEQEQMGMLHNKLEKEKQAALLEQKEHAELKQQEAIKAACNKLRKQLLIEAEEVRRQEVEQAVTNATKDMEKRMEEAIENTRADSLILAEAQHQRLAQLHAAEVKALHDRLKSVEQDVADLVRQKMEYEKQFKEVQLNYKRFIDLTESSLHSDYLLQLRHLGKSPGQADEEVQTDIMVVTTKYPARK